MSFHLPAQIDPRHCIITKQYAIYTPPMDEMISQIGDWIDQQRPGGYIYGASRLGKSKGIRWYLRKILEERFENVLPLVIWNRRPDSQKSEAGFWHQILLASGFEFANPAKPPKTCEANYLCRQRLTAIARTASRNYVVLLIDEAQDISYVEWKWLVGMQNALDEDGILLSVFSVGSHQLGYRHEYLASTGNAHVAARFLVAHARFHGIRAIDELEYVLIGYDADSEWPRGSGRSFLEYFAPTYYAAGARLKECAPLLWKAMVELSPVDKIEYPMQHIARTIEAVLLEIAKGATWDEATKYENWLDHLGRTNFSDHMRIIATAG